MCGGVGVHTRVPMCAAASITVTQGKTAMLAAYHNGMIGKGSKVLPSIPIEGIAFNPFSCLA